MSVRQDHTREVIELATQLNAKCTEMERIRSRLRKMHAEDDRLRSVAEAILSTYRAERAPLLPSIEGLIRRYFVWAGLVLSVFLVVTGVLAQAFGLGTLSHASLSDGPGVSISDVLGAATFMVLLLVAAAIILVSFFQSRSGFATLWGNLNSVLTSGVFYFFAGLALLLYAIHTSSREHPALVFLIAMLGMAIMLFGTGSQAVGTIATGGARELDPLEAGGGDSARRSIRVGGPESLAADHPARAAEESAKRLATVLVEGQTIGDAEKAAALSRAAALAQENLAAAKAASAAMDSGNVPIRTSSWDPVKANAAIAGGAAALTAIFGLGVILLRGGIAEVFSNYDSYAFIRIEACALNSGQCGQKFGRDPSLLRGFQFGDYAIQARAGNNPLHVSYGSDWIELLVLRSSLRQAPDIRIKAERNPANPNQAFDDLVEITIEPDIFGEREAGTENDGRNERIQATNAARVNDASCSVERDDNCKLLLARKIRQDRIDWLSYSYNVAQGAQAGEPVQRTSLAVPDTTGESRADTSAGPTQIDLEPYVLE